VKASAVLLAAACVQFLALIVAAMFIDARWPRNVYPYVRYPRWIDWAMFTGMAALVVTIAASALLIAAGAIRETRRAS
jgi:hypothetical protein